MGANGLNVFALLPKALAKRSLLFVFACSHARSLNHDKLRSLSPALSQGEREPDMLDAARVEVPRAKGKAQSAKTKAQRASSALNLARPEEE